MYADSTKEYGVCCDYTYENDYIVEIDGKSTKGMTVKDAADNIKGEEVNLTAKEFDILHLLITKLFLHLAT